MAQCLHLPKVTIAAGMPSPKRTFPARSPKLPKFEGATMNFTINRAITVVLAGVVVFNAGCSTKKYVRNQTAPLINKTNELDDITAKNSRDIKDVDTRAQAAIQQVNSKTAEVEQKTQTAAQQASQAQTQADNAVHRVDVLQNAVANLRSEERRVG